MLDILLAYEVNYCPHRKETTGVYVKEIQGTKANSKNYTTVPKTLPQNSSPTGINATNYSQSLKNENRFIKHINVSWEFHTAKEQTDFVPH